MPGSRLPNICRKDDLTSGRNDDVTSGTNDDVTSGDEEFSAAANRARISAMEAVWKQHKFKFLLEHMGSGTGIVLLIADPSTDKIKDR
jgi:hypothetical protein